MNRWTVFIATVLVYALVALGCSGGGHPVAPASEPDLAVGAQSHGNSSQTHLWGFYDVYIDIETQTVEAVLNRQAMFAANVVQFLNSNPLNLQFKINGTPATTEYVDVDIDVSMTHPFPGLTAYNGYDVRGIFIGDGSQDSPTCFILCCFSLLAKEGTDQFMRDYNETGDALECGNPDGYTRWWNPTEFFTPGVLGYTDGKFATPGYKGTATVNPFKYFADGLGPCDDQWDFLTGGTTDGVFSAGAKNTRNYYLRFPSTKGVRYNYAVVANWIDETTHPANAPEALACKVEVTPDIYYVDAGNWGGDLILDISLFDWDSTVGGGGVMEDYTVAVVSWDLFQDDATTPERQYVCSPAEMTPVGSGTHYYTYHVEIPVTKLEGREGNEFMVKAICGKPDGTVFEDYQNDFGVPNDAGAWPLTGYFRFPIFVNDKPYNQDPVCDLEVVTPMPHVGDGAIEFDASGSSDPDGDALTFEWDFDGDGVYGESPDDDYTGPPDHPIHQYTTVYVGDVCVRVTDGKGGEDICCVEVDVTPCLETAYTCGAGESVGYDSAYELTSGFSTVAGDDGCAYGIPIGFTFSFAGTNYTSVCIEYNGGIDFGSNCWGWYPYGCPSYDIPWPYIWAYQADMNPNFAPVRYGTKVVNGVNCFIVHWENCPRYYNSGQHSFQIILMDGCQNTNDPWRIQWRNLTLTAQSTFRTGTQACCISSSVQPNTGYLYGWLP